MHQDTDQLVMNLHLRWQQLKSENMWMNQTMNIMSKVIKEREVAHKTQ